ncbi:MAG: signal peptidase II [Thiobacillus sp.]
MGKWLGVAALVIALDHLTKWWISSSMDYQQTIPLLSFFSIVRVHNYGAAFSFLAEAGGWQRWFFIAIGAVATVIIVQLLRKHAQDFRMAFALALILGGALGNVIDRVVLGYVVDFLYFHYRGFSWPAFNVADSAISVGAAVLIWDSLFSKTHKAGQV